MNGCQRESPSRHKDCWGCEAAHVAAADRGRTFDSGSSSSLQRPRLLSLVVRRQTRRSSARSQCMTKLFVETSIEIDAPASRVWAVLTSPALNSQWSGLSGAKGAIDTNWQPGSPVKWRNADCDVYVHGRVLVAEPGRRLQFSARATNPALQPLSGLEEDDITHTYALSEAGRVYGALHRARRFQLARQRGSDPSQSERRLGSGSPEDSRVGRTEVTEPRISSSTARGSR